MISRETGDEIIEKNDGTSKINKIVVDSDSDGVSSDTSNMPLDDSSVPTCVLSDVELYKIYFKK